MTPGESVKAKRKKKLYVSLSQVKGERARQEEDLHLTPFLFGVPNSLGRSVPDGPRRPAPQHTHLQPGPGSLLQREGLTHVPYLSLKVISSPAYRNVRGKIKVILAAELKAQGEIFQLGVWVLRGTKGAGQA